MKVTVISVGKIKEKYFVNAIKEYEKRLGKYCKIDLVEVADEKCPENLSPKDMEIVKDKEADRIEAKINPNSYVITLEIEGKQHTSEGFSDTISKLMVTGNSHLTFIIGGSLGLADRVKSKSKMKLSFSKMTLPHQLMKVVLLEQIYRAFRIMKNEPYHK